MSYPVSHKTVFVLDHSPHFSMPCDLVEFDSIKFSQPQAHVGLPPIGKTMWSSCTESVLEYCRVVWDVFPPDTPEQKLIRFVVSDAKGQSHVLNQWEEGEQSTAVVSAALAKVGRPEPESRRKFSAAKGYDISRGVETGLKILCEATRRQSSSSGGDGSLPLNRGRMVVLAHLRDGRQLKEVLEAFRADLAEINQVAANSDIVSAISNLELHVVHCFPANQMCDVDVAAEVPMPPNVQCKVFAVTAGLELSKKMMSLALAHYGLASTTVTGIPMKEEQNASSSANYDVELFHKASAHAKLLSSNEMASCMSSADGVDGSSSWIPQARKEGHEYSTITLKWCTPRGTASDLHNCTQVARVTPIDVNSRHSSCLTNFLLNGRSVMLEMPSKRCGYKLLSHMLTSHGGEIFIHTLNISRSALEDPPSVSEGPGGRVTDYRITDLGALMKANRLAPYYGDPNAWDRRHADPLEKAHRRLSRHTLCCPMTISSTTIFNMASVETLQQHMVSEEMTSEMLADCHQAIYSLLSMESKGDSLPVPMIQQNNKAKLVKKEDQYRIMFNELENFLSLHCRSENHQKVLNCLLEVRNKPTVEGRPPAAAAAAASKSSEADVALREFDKYSAMTEREKSDFNMSRDGVLRSTTESPMSPTAGRTPPAAKRPRKEASASLLDIWKGRLEKENAKHHVPFAGEANFGEIAKLYLNLERKVGGSGGGDPKDDGGGGNPASIME